MTEAKAKKQPMKTIGRIACLVCGELTPLKEQSGELAAMSCNWCGAQLYCRSKHCDGILRKEMKPMEHAPPTTPAAAPVAAAPKTEPQPKPAKKSGSLLENL